MVYGFAFHMDKLPGGVQLWVQQWLSKEHERPATTSKLIAYHLELWFSDNRCCCLTSVRASYGQLSQAGTDLLWRFPGLHCMVHIFLRLLLSVQLQQGAVAAVPHLGAGMDWGLGHLCGHRGVPV